ncbi:MAG: DMT family transporter [Atopobiaceae bacterium]|jgi:drug/metabolite transporter (DMT)-like permease|nr:DMT family transporter [Atopobiaceae bacterium]MCI2174019.1 DMT family transporter [Atopobiaceae bacterium]MCI2207891.1 DMT family transporter [Atopobiaceae bacterium]
MKRQRTSALSRPLVVAALACVACLLWGSAVPVTRIGFSLFSIGTDDTGGQLLFAGTRFMLAGTCVLVAWALLAHRRGELRPPHVRDLRAAAVVSLFQTVGQYLLYYIGLAHSTGVTGSIVQGVGVFVSLLASCLLFRMERLTGQKVAGCLVGFAGLIVADLASLTSGAGFTFMGEGLVMLSAVCTAMAGPFVRRYSARTNPVLMCGLQFVMGGAVLACIGAAAGGTFSVDGPTQAVTLAWLVMVSAVAYSLWSVLLAHNDVSHVTVFGFMTPVFGVILSLLLLGDEGHPQGIATAISLVLVCIGIVMVSRTPETDDASGEEDAGRD